MAEEFAPFQQDAMIGLGNMWMERSATLIGTMTNRNVSIAKGQFKLTTKEKLEQEFPGPRFLAEVGIEGVPPIYLFLTAEDAATIVDLVIGGDGKGVMVEFSDLHLSVLEEAVNEMSASLADIFSTLFNSPQKVFPTKGQVNGFSGLASNSLVDLLFNFSIEGLLDSHIHTLIDMESAQLLAERLYDLGPQSGIADATPKAKEPLSPKSAPVLSPSSVPPASSYPPAQAAAFPQAPSPSYTGHVMPTTVAVPVSTAVVEREIPARPVQLPELTPHAPATKMGNLDLILDVSLQLTAVLGRSPILIKDLIELGPGSVLELDKLAGEPVELLVNNKLVARGEVVVIDEKFGVRITDIVSQVERIKGLKG